MCWNASVSLNTFLLGLFASGLSLYNGLITWPYFMFFMSFCSMQLIEYFTWSKTFSNRSLSQAALLLAFSQPAFGLFKVTTISKQFKGAILALYGAVCLFVLTVLYPWNQIDFRMIPAENGHLSWKWLDFTLPALSIWIFFYLLQYILQKEYYLLFFANVAAIIGTYTLYHKTLTWGSMWCWIANGVSLFLLYEVFTQDLCGFK